MRTLLSTTMMLAAIAATGCVGTLEPDTNPGVDAGDDIDAPIAATAGRRAFDRDVQPLLTGNCAGSSCHEGTGTPLKFLGTTSTDDNYTVLTAVEHTQLTGGYNPGSSMLLLKGAHQSVPAWTTPQADLIRGWLVQEAMDRGIDTSNPPNPVPTGPLTSRQALAQFSSCMQYADWTSTQMYTWADKGSGNGQCKACHGDSAGLFNTNDDDTVMFDMNRKELFIKSFFLVGLKDVAQPELGYTVYVNAAKFIAKGGGNGNSHPNFTYTNDNTYRPRLEAFHLATMNHVMANTGGCAAGNFPTE